MRARAARPQIETQLVWQPFRLNPELPPEGINRKIYLRTKFGDAARLEAVDAALEESGRRENIRFAFPKLKRVPNTLHAHRLMRWAGAANGTALAEAIFSTYFEQGRDIGDAGVLAQCAADAGLDADAARTFLASDAEKTMVISMDETARESGITGVPYFIFDRRYALAGAQEPSAFLPIFDILASDGMLVSPA